MTDVEILETQPPDELRSQYRFAQVPEMALTASANAVKLYAILDRYANGARRCWPGQKVLADKMGVTDRTIRTIMTELMAGGWLGQGTRRYNGTTIWTLYQVPLPESDRKQISAPDRKQISGRCGSRLPPNESHDRESLNESHSLAPDEPPPRKRGRAADPIWDALMEVCGITTVTQSARGAYAKAAKSLRDVEATPDEIRRRAQIFRQQWPEASLTPTALERRWGECNQVKPGPASNGNGRHANITTDRDAPSGRIKI